MVTNQNASDTAKGFDWTIDVPFAPDELIVKQVSLNGLVDGASWVYYIRCPALTLAPLCSAINGVSTELKNSFTLSGQQVGGSYSFYYYSGSIQVQCNAYLAIHLEFVKYSK